MSRAIPIRVPTKITEGNFIDVTAPTASEDGKALVLNWSTGIFDWVDLATAAELASHTGNTSNPHGVTAAQVGAYTTAQTDSAIGTDVAAHAALTTTHGVSGAIVGTTDTQTLTNKTLTAPTIASFANAAHTHQNAAGGAQLDHGLALTGLGDDDHTQYLLATGTRTGASSQAQTFTNGVKTGKIITISDSTNAVGFYKANGTSQDIYYDSTDGFLGIGSVPSYPLHIKVSGNYSAAIGLQTALHTWTFVGGDSGYSSTTTTWKYDGTPFARFTSNTEAHIIGKMSVSTNGSPTAVLDIAASTTTAASLRIRSGTAPSSPNAGDVWFDGTNLKFYDGSTTRTINWT